MKRVFSLFTILLINLLNGVDLQYKDFLDADSTYSVSYKALITDLTSDYGMRYNQYVWHKGNDFGVHFNEHDIVLAPVSGTIEKISFEALTSLRLVLKSTNQDGYEFKHIFKGFNQNIQPSQIISGNTILCGNHDLNEEENGIVFLNRDHPALSTGISPALDSLSFTYNDSIYTVNATNEVSAGDMLCPVGDSYNYPVHLHLSKYRDALGAYSTSNCMDPLVAIDLYETQSSTQPNNTIYNVSLEGNIQDSLLFGDSSNHILVRCEMYGATPNPGNHYTNAAMNLDRVDLLIKSKFSNGDYHLIRGPYLESKIILGGRENTSIYPDTTTTNPAGNNIDIKLYSRYGGFDSTSWNTGILPWAYRDVNGYAYDDYYFCDFVLRIKDTDEFGGQKDLAECNGDARYPDGRYTLKAKAVTVRDSVYWSEPQEILIDNFVPFIKEVKIYSSGSTVYWSGWQWWDATGLVFSDQTDTPARAENDITIKVTASEPMTTLNITAIQPLNWNPTQPESISEDKTEWLFRIPASQLPSDDHDGTHTITINGTDLAGNLLEQMQEDNSPYPASLIPKRQSATESDFLPLLNPAADSNHHFTLVSHSAGYNNNKTIKAIQTNASLEPEFDSGSAYILTNLNSIHDDFNLVAWGYSSNINGTVLYLDPNYIQPINDLAYKGMELVIGDSSYAILGSTYHMIFFTPFCSAPNGNYKIYDPIDKIIENIGISDWVYNGYSDSFVTYSDCYQNSDHYRSTETIPPIIRYTLTMSGETHDIRSHSNTQPPYVYQQGEWFFSDYPSWVQGDTYELKRKFPVSVNDIVTFDTLHPSTNPGYEYGTIFAAVGGWNNTSGSIARGDCDDDVVYNLDDGLDYIWDGDSWEAVEYPELQLTPNTISHVLNKNETENDLFTITNVGDGDLTYSANLTICTDSTFVDSLGDLNQDYDIEELRCSISREGFSATIETNGVAPMGLLFIDADRNSSTGLPWENNGVNLPFGGMDKNNIKKAFSKTYQQDKQKILNTDNLMGIDYCAILEYGYSSTNCITIISFSNPNFFKEYYTISITESHYEFSFPVSILSTSNGYCDGNMDFFFTFLDEGFVNKDFAPDTGFYSLRGLLDWIIMTPVASTIVAGSSHDIDLYLSSGNLTGGIYNAFIAMDTNDMFCSNPSIPVVLEVIGVPDISADPMLISFGEVEIGDTSEETIQITNVGDGILSISNITCNDSNFSFQSFTGDIYPGNFYECLISFTPSTEGQISGELLISTNDPDEPQITIPLSGSGFQVIPPLDPPQNVSVELTGNSILISWNPQTRSASVRSIAYIVYSSDNPNSGFTEDLTGIYTSSSWTAPYIYDKRFFYVCATDGSPTDRKSVSANQIGKSGKNINRTERRTTIHELPIKKKNTSENTKRDVNNNEGNLKAKKVKN